MSEKTVRLSALPAITNPAEDSALILTDASGSAQRVKISDLLRLVRDSIQIGGRNLLLDSGSKLAGDYGIGSYHLAVPWEAGKTYTMTIHGTIGEGKQNAYQIWDNGGIRPLFNCHQVSPGVYRGTFNATKYDRYDEDGARRRFNIHVMPNSVRVECTIEQAKFEEGNMPTAWTPAPEDLMGNWGG